MLTSYHNHTTWSDGACSLVDLIEEARRVGLNELGISDHYVLFPGGAQVDWSMPLDHLEEYVAQLQAAAENVKDVKLRIGIEADFFPETVDELRCILTRYPFDFVIGSVHYVDGFPVDAHRQYWDALPVEECEGKWQLYWRRVRQMAESRVFDFVAHLDLPKKFGYRPRSDFTAEALAALDTIAAADMAIEINTAGWNLPAQEAYPSFDLLRAARARGIPLLINADAHIATHLTRHFERARSLAREAGYDSLVCYESRRRFPVPL
jgi:histidinol-phosphatase (PHP family)